MSDAPPSGLERTVEALASGLEVTQAATGGGARPDDVLPRGHQLRRYVITQVLGAGGMGTVYAAYDPDLDRKVAIKLLHRRVAQGAGGPLRLLREAQAMARLSHPAVITVHDVGVVGDQLFVAMELIDGVDLRRWLAEGRRSWRECVEVFLAAGAGLEAAHAAGIVHRDFKPDNVMVARSGRICVADFGLAAAFADVDAAPSRSSWLSRDLSLTQGAAMGTPAYMAPEQFEGATVGPAADIFAFCVALWEAVYGARPFPGETLHAIYGAIVAGRIAPPSARGVPRRLERALRRGLAERPEARPAAIGELLGELRALLRSRRRAVVGGGAIALAIAGAAAIGAASAGPPRCRGAGEAIAEVWSPAAKHELRRIYRASGVHHGPDTAELAIAALDRAADAWARGREDACEATHVRGEYSEAILDRRMACFDDQLAQLRRLVEFLGADDRAVIDAAVPLIHGLDGPDACAAAAVLAGGDEAAVTPERAELRAAIDRARLLHSAGKYREAVEVVDPAIARLRELDAPRDLARALAAGSHSAYVDDRPDARARLDEALQAAIVAGDDRLFASIAGDYVGLVRADPDARALWRGLGEAALQRIGGAESVRAKILTNVASALRGEGRMAEAEQLDREVLDIRRRGDGAPELIADALYSLSSDLDATGRREEAEAALAEAIALWTEHLGPQHPRLTMALRLHAYRDMRDARYAEAAVAAERALALTRATRGDGHAEVGVALMLTGTIANWRGDLDGAVARYEEAQRIIETSGTKRTQFKAMVALTRSSLDVDRRDLEHAEAMAERAVELLGDAEVDGQWAWIGVRLARGEVALRRGDLERAADEVARAEGLIDRFGDPSGVEPVATTLLAAEVLRRRGRPEEALARLDALGGARPHPFVHPYIQAQHAFGLARVRRDLGDLRGAADAADAALRALAPLEPGFALFRREIAAWRAEGGSPEN